MKWVQATWVMCRRLITYSGLLDQYRGDTHLSQEKGGETSGYPGTNNNVVMTT